MSEEPTSDKRDAYRPLREEYAGLAKYYDQRWATYLEASVSHLVSRLQASSNARVLDVGCGTGALLERLSASSSQERLVGVDLSVDMLEVARAKFRGEVELYEARAEALPFERHEFDTVVSSSVFHYVQDPEQALKEFGRVLEPNGCLLLTDWCADFWSTRFSSLLLTMSGRPLQDVYGAEDLRSLMERAGFEVLELERFRASWLWGMMTLVVRKVP